MQDNAPRSEGAGLAEGIGLAEPRLTIPMIAVVTAAAPATRVAPTATFRLRVTALSLSQRWSAGGLWQRLISLF